MNLNRVKQAVPGPAAGGLLLVALLLSLSAAPHPVRADAVALFVTTDGSGDCSQADPCNLQTALRVATEGDSLYLAHGTYTGSGGAVVAITQSITLQGGWDGTTAKPVVLDPQTYPTTLDGEGERRVVTITGDIVPTVDGFVITRGNANDETQGSGAGGGIYSEDANPIIRNNVILSNTASISPTSGRGGGICLIGASDATLISNNQVLSNTAHSDRWGHGGGGLYLSHADAIVHDNLIQGNTCSQAGGGIYIGSSGAPRILGNEIRSNRSDLNGGGIYARYSSRPHIEGNLITDNAAVHFGGGAMLVNGAQPTVVANRVLSNTARSGGGVVVETSGYYTVTNNFVAHNKDGGIKIWDTTKYGLVAHNTVAFNMGAEGGIYLAEGYITPTVVSNIVVSNTYGIRAHTNASGTLDYNDVWGNTTEDYVLPGALEPGPHDIQADPRFTDVADDDYHLQADSPCIDAGCDVGPAFDIDGDPRPVGAGFDIGADEFRLRYVYLPLVRRIVPGAQRGGHTGW